jgi:hypothetical protein
LKREIILTYNFRANGLLYCSSSPAIVRNPEKPGTYLCLVRCNTYPEFFRDAINELVELDSQFSAISKVTLPKPTNTKYEDFRLFFHKGSLYYIGVKRIEALFTVMAGPWTGKIPVGLPVKVTFPTTLVNEKNWVFVDYKDRLCVIYKWYPLYICELDMERNELVLLETRPMPEGCERFCGSSCGVLVKNEIWFTVHYHTSRSYRHVFIVFDTDMNLLRYSEPFIIDVTREFAYTLLIEDDTIVIGYSCFNRSTKVRVYDYAGIVSGLTWHGKN